MIIEASLIISLTICSIHSLNTAREADRGEFPYVVSIQRYDRHWCSGAIINENHILTAGHTVIGILSSELSVVVGTIEIQENSSLQTNPVKEIYVHPHLQRRRAIEGVSDENWKNDIAILKLTESLVWSSDVAPIPFPDQEMETYTCFDCTIVSWYYPQQNVRNLTALGIDYVEIMSDRESHELGISLSTNQKCFINILFDDFTNSEDIGSPVICGNAMFGIVVKDSREKKPGSLSTVLSIFPYSAFITGIIEDGRVSRPEQFPYAASFWYHGNYLCGGCIVSASHIITAGHCLWRKRRDYLKVAIGSTEVSQLSPSIMWLTVKDFQRPWNYKMIGNYATENWFIENDITIAKLTEPMPLGPTVNKIPKSGSHIFTERICQVLNWKSEFDATGREKIKLQISLAELLNEGGPSIFDTRYQFTASSPYAKPLAYHRDTGNPIVCEGFPIGIIIKADSTDEKFLPKPIIFLSLSAYESFIRSISED